MHLAKLKWHCRRGMRELDVLLEEFLAQGYDSLSPTGKESFERLLDRPNEDLIAWFINGNNPEDEALAEVVRLVRRRSGCSV